MSGKMMAIWMASGSETALAWCAGFLDGDGCVSITKQQMPGRKNLTYRLRLTLVQNCLETLEAFQAAVGEKSFVTTQGPKLEHNRQIYSLIYDGQHALAALTKLEPYLVRKRMSSIAARMFWSDGRMGTLPGPKGFDKEVWRTREYWFNKLRRMK